MKLLPFEQCVKYVYLIYMFEICKPNSKERYVKFVPRKH